jgi:biopolymer transport protein ExbB
MSFNLAQNTADDGFQPTAPDAQPNAMEALPSSEPVADPSFFSLEGLTGFIDLGGPVVMILLGLSVIAFTITLVKAIQFLPTLFSSDKNLDNALQLWSTHKRGEALEVFQNTRGEIAKLCHVAGSKLVEDPASKAAVESETEQKAVVYLSGLRSGLRSLDIIAQIAPLLGLFGTILGMIEAFKVLESTSGGSVDPSALAGGIWVALLTTAVGLGVAMPVAVVHQSFESLIERQQQRLEGMLTRLFASAPAAAVGTPHPVSAIKKTQEHGKPILKRPDDLADQRPNQQASW